MKIAARWIAAVALAVTLAAGAQTRGQRRAGMVLSPLDPPAPPLPPSARPCTKRAGGPHQDQHGRQRRLAAGRADDRPDGKLYTSAARTSSDGEAFTRATSSSASSAKAEGSTNKAKAVFDNISRVETRRTRTR
jgi:hypothetical protein